MRPALLTYCLLPTLVLCLAPRAPAGPKGAPAPPAVAASSAILVDAESGQVLFEKNADARRPPASTTKILTTVLLIEGVEPETQIEADKPTSETDGSSLYMLPGEKIAAGELVYALLLRSANDACVAVAKHVSGTELAFAELMNRKAAEIGATDSHFVNPNGLHAKGHYTTARDLARIACYAARLPRFNEAARTKYRTIERDPRNKDTFLKNRAKFLWHYPGADGIKTGYTVPAGRCFVGSATRDGWRLISVVLNSPDMFGETQRLMDYGYASYEPRVLLRAGGYSTQVAVRGGVRADVRAVTAGPIRLVVPRGSSQASRMRVRRTAVSAPVALGAVIGEVVIETVGALTGSTPIVAAQSVPKATIPIRRGPIWPRLLATALSLAVFWYGSANSKAPRGLRRSFAARMRDHHRGGPRHR